MKDGWSLGVFRNIFVGRRGPGVNPCRPEHLKGKMTSRTCPEDLRPLADAQGPVVVSYVQAPAAAYRDRAETART